MSEKVLLTGISGFVAKHVAIELLNSGYEVLGTVRNSNSIEQTKKTLEENNVAINNLSFVELDLLKDEGWNEAAEGCKYIIHVASPFPLKVSNDRESLTPAAKDGTLRVLNAGINAGVEHFVKTSSIVCMFRKPNRSNPYTFGENDWTDLDWDKTTDYFVSKTRAEKAAWDLMESKGLKSRSEVRSILELSQIMAKNIPSHAKKLPKRELPNFMVKLLSYIDTSAKNMVPDLGLKMQTDQRYAEEILQMKFIASEIAVVDAAKSVIRLNLA